MNKIDGFVELIFLHKEMEKKRLVIKNRLNEYSDGTDAGASYRFKGMIDAYESSKYEIWRSIKKLYLRTDEEELGKMILNEGSKIRENSGIFIEELIRILEDVRNELIEWYETHVC